MRVIAAALVFLAVLAPPAGADEGSFLAGLDSAGLSHNGAARATAAGQAICQLFDQGWSPSETILAVQSTNPGFTLQHAATFTALAVLHLCPRHM